MRRLQGEWPPATLLFILLLFLSLLPGSSSEGTSFRTTTIQASPFSLEYTEGAERPAREALQFIPDLVSEIRNDLGWEYTSPGTILLTRGSEFSSIIRNQQITAIAIGERSLIIMDITKTAPDPFLFRSTLKHEMIHILLHQHIRKGLLPRWLNEGVSQMLSDGVSEILFQRKGNILRQARLAKRLIRLPDLDNAFRRPETIILAYEESKSLVEYIERATGKGTVKGILHQMGEGKRTEEAVYNITGKTLYEIERDWIKSIGRKDSILSYLSNSFVTILFALGALLTAFGFIRMLIRKRRYRDEDDEEPEFPCN
jgi:hypothetical protein